jgi:hypothetical protein
VTHTEHLKAEADLQRLIEFANEVVDDMAETEHLYPMYVGMLERGRAALKPFQEQETEG